MKAVIYARYSSHNQREESIEGQIKRVSRIRSKEWVYDYKRVLR